MNEKDRDAFAKAMEGVKPLRRDERVSTLRKPSPKPRNARAIRRQMLSENLDDLSLIHI